MEIAEEANDSMILINGTTSSIEDYVPYTKRLETYYVPVLFAIIFLIGVLGNGTLVLIFVRHKKMRNVPNTYIISLAVGDLLLILTCVPFTSTVYTFESWPYGTILCKISESMKDISMGVSVFTLTALSAERYCAISNPIRRRISSKPFTTLIATGIWLMATLLALPSAILSHVETTQVTNGLEIQYCNPYPEELGSIYRKGLVVFKFVVYYALPLIVIACFYSMMAFYLERTTRNIPGEIQGQSSQIRARKKVAKVVLSFVILFMVCFLPSNVFMLWYHLWPTAQEDFNEFWHALRILSFCLTFINSCINPIALYFISSVFRKYFNRYLFKWCKMSIFHRNANNVSARTTSVSCRRQDSLLTHHITLTTLGHS